MNASSDLHHSSHPSDNNHHQKEGTRTPCAHCQRELSELEKKCAEYLAGWQRATADYQNLQKQTVHRVNEMQRMANEEFLLELLPMIDHFRYAFQGIPEAERHSNWVKGIEHIQNNFRRILEDHGISLLDTVGKPFDPEYHEAVEEVHVEGTASGIVVEEVASGFLLNGKLIQSAKVKVTK